MTDDPLPDCQASNGEHICILDAGHWEEKHQCACAAYWTAAPDPRSVGW